VTTTRGVPLPAPPAWWVELVHASDAFASWWTPTHLGGVLVLAAALGWALAAPEPVRAAWGELRVRVGTVALMLAIAALSAVPHLVFVAEVAIPRHLRRVVTHWRDHR
jgi:hypothetical protein